jgi:hypothetical protein
VFEHPDAAEPSPFKTRRLTSNILRGSRKVTHAIN